MSRPEVHVWRAPVALGVATAAGLVVALVADGPLDHVSSAALAVPVVVSLWFALRPRGSRA